VIDEGIGEGEGEVVISGVLCDDIRFGGVVMVGRGVGLKKTVGDPKVETVDPHLGQIVAGTITAPKTKFILSGCILQPHAEKS